MVLRLRRPKADLTLEVTEGPIWPGDKVEVRVSLSPQEAFFVREGRVELACVETRYISWGEGEPTKHTRVRWQSALPFVTDTKVVEGLYYGGNFNFSVPDDAQPTIGGQTAVISWRIQAIVDVARARDFRCTRKLNVFSPVPDPSPAVAAEKEFDQCSVMLSLDSATVCAGENLYGQFNVRVRELLAVEGIRLVLYCSEKALDKEKCTAKGEVFLMAEEELVAGQDLEWPIRLHVPKNRLPSASVHDTHVVWWLEGIIDRRMRGDLAVQQGIQVYTAP